MNAKKWNLCVLGGMLLALGVLGGVTIYVDPAFHFHKPLSNLSYPLGGVSYERYGNDGIIKHFQYDALITGNSMVENFHPSEWDELTGSNTIKVPFQSGFYKEINDNVKTALESNTELKTVIRCLDYARLVVDKDSVMENFSYPTYLYNENPFDDVQYIWNMDVFFEQTIYTLFWNRQGKETTSFDDYVYWSDSRTYGKEAVLNSYTLEEKVTTEQILSEEEKILIIDNLQQNVVDTAKAYPDVTFYLFLSPYSIGYYDQLNQQGKLDWFIEAKKVAIEELLQCDNIKLFSFDTNFDMICDLDNYSDYYHYGAWINSQILQWMSKDEYLLTKENYMEHLNSQKSFCKSYDYEKLH